MPTKTTDDRLAELRRALRRLQPEQGRRARQNARDAVRLAARGLIQAMDRGGEAAPTDAKGDPVRKPAQKAKAYLSPEERHEIVDGVLRTCCGRWNVRADRDDMLQEAHIAVQRALETADPGRGSVKQHCWMAAYREVGRWLWRQASILSGGYMHGSHGRAEVVKIPISYMGHQAANDNDIPDHRKTPEARVSQRQLLNAAHRRLVEIAIARGLSPGAADVVTEAADMWDVAKREHRWIRAVRDDVAALREAASLDAKMQRLWEDF
jgi:hypothetical protein